MNITKLMLSRFCIRALGFLLLAGASPSLAVLVAQPSQPKTTGAYDYPIKPGTPEWAALKTYDERLTVLQIPPKVLQNMTTVDLVQTVLDYPHYGDMIFYNSVQAGFERVAKGFNGLKELLQRSDAGSVLLVRYKGMNPAAMSPDWSMLQQGKFAQSFMDIETLLAQDAILASMTKAQRRELLAETLLKSQQKGQFMEIYGHNGLARVALLMGRILKRENFAPLTNSMKVNAGLDIFLRDGMFIAEEIISEIRSHAQQLLSIGLVSTMVRPASFKLHRPIAPQLTDPR